jgi:tRNA dimethylallyltransferase
VARAQETAGAHDAISAIVGGSLFYIKSLYFPIHAQSLPTVQWQDMPDCTNQELWNQLHDIDPTRARAIHINDRYRLVRALNVWQQTGTAPSSFEPMFAPQFQSLFIFLAPPSEQLRENIAVRTSHMLASGWIEETKQLLDTPWEPFLLKKGLIGYPAIIEWLRDGARQASFAALHERIVTDTWQYARRQIIFWRSLERSLTKNKNNSPFGCTVLSLSAVHDATVDHIVQMLENLRKG